ncbi:hypothetical protein [Rummeliibacillus suwonensis]|uniref:hypothetical protein n=1 Tax=Rummeliibacillus suwonensis TaxID=1306154 RepID=UPI0028A09E31|nr:hypothetical protein [Rummeliibacillus suwonensis]
MGGSTARKNPIGSAQQDVGHSGVATGRGVFNLSSSTSAGDEDNPPLMEFHFIDWNVLYILEGLVP